MIIIIFLIDPYIQAIIIIIIVINFFKMPLIQLVTLIVKC